MPILSMGGDKFNFIYYSSKDRKSIVLLLVILLSITTANFIYSSLNVISAETARELEVIYIQKLKQKEAKVITNTIDNKHNFKEGSIPASYKNKKQEKLWAPFDFDPNEIEDSLWLQFGLTKKQIAVIRNYKDKVGTFNKVEDLKNVYSISDDTYDRITPFVKFHKSESANIVEETKNKKILELNTCEFSDLTSILSIDPEHVNAIFDYRKRLGGYYSLEQLREIENIPDSIVTSLTDRLQLDNRYLSKKNVNTDAAYQLQHPYISKGLANLIENYRQEHGNYKSPEDLKKLSLMNNELYSKLLPYLIVE